MTEWTDEAKHLEGIHGDRRSDRRYDIQLELRWKLIRRRRVLENGVGQTIDLSSGGILFDPGRQLPVGLNVELSIAWPVLLRNVAPMQLIVSGRIVRATGNRTGVVMVQHEFRTSGMLAEARNANNGSTRTPPTMLASGTSAMAFGKYR